MGARRPIVKTTPDLIVKARGLRRSGLSYANVGHQLGVSTNRAIALVNTPGWEPIELPRVRGICQLVECGKPFLGDIRQRYCNPACRSKAHQRRNPMGEGGGLRGSRALWWAVLTLLAERGESAEARVTDLRG